MGPFLNVTVLRLAREACCSPTIAHPSTNFLLWGAGNGAHSQGWSPLVTDRDTSTNSTQNVFWCIRIHVGRPVIVG